jgi:hypothetical protein
MKKLIVVLTIVAVAAMTFTAGAEAGHRHYVFCGNFSGQGMDPHVARKPANCDVTRLGRNGTVAKLRSMHWTRWGRHAQGRGLVNRRQSTVRLRRARRCGRHGEFRVYSQMKIGRPSNPWRRILYCGD